MASAVEGTDGLHGVKPACSFVVRLLCGLRLHLLLRACVRVTGGWLPGFHACAPSQPLLLAVQQSVCTPLPARVHLVTHQCALAGPLGCARVCAAVHWLRL